uniref:27.6 kDa salivary protein n=1 Tax=Phlebotomus duboscqi TaxID=37738 RepID=Q06K42_PHLDU|nr:27.6 kDa salivary protein [Phlebotomus duboscqi]ABI20181.1 D7-like protein [Phlebotomus duboscqi]
MNSAVQYLVLFSILRLGYSWQFPRNADQTYWAFNTCQRETTDAKSVKLWDEWKLPNNNATHCYVKCVFIHLGFYNEQDKSINVDAVKKQFKGRGLASPKNIKSLSGQTDGSCEALYKKTIPFFIQNFENLRKAFYGTREESDKWFAEHPEVKPKRTKVSEFCTPEKERGETNNCRRACSLYYYRFIDEDYQPIYFRKLDIEGITDKQINECRDKATERKGCKVGDALYRCLRLINKKGLLATIARLDHESWKY